MTDTNHHVLTGKVDITSNLLVGSSHLFVDTNNNRVGLVTTNPEAGLHVNSNAYVNTDLRVGPAGVNQVVINATAGRVKAGSFEGDGSLLENIPAGVDGAAATIGDPTITTGLAGTDASVTNSGTSSAAVFDFVIPRGDAGASATIGDPTITTGLAGTDASVTNSGTSSAAVFDFVIPRGDAGTDGTNYFELSGSNIYRLAGNVGIGTSSPMNTGLHIAKQYTASGGNTDHFDPQLFITGNSGTAGTQVSAIGFSGASDADTHQRMVGGSIYYKGGGGNYGMDGYLGLAVANPSTSGTDPYGLTEGELESHTRLAITNNGNVGLGLTSPDGPLHLNLPVKSNYTGFTYQSGDVKTVLGNAEGGTNTSFVQVYSGVTSSVPDTNSSTYNLALQPHGGNVGIGGVLQPVETLDILGSMRIGGDGMLTIESRTNPSFNYGNESVCLQTTIDGRALSDASPGTYGGENRNVLSLQPDGGYVGVGAVSPNYKLHVSGNIRADTGKRNLFYAPTNWSYETSSTSGTILWSFTYNFPYDGYANFNVNGHFHNNISNKWVYAKVVINGASTAATSGYYDSHTVGGAGTHGGDFHSYKDSSVSWQDFNWGGTLKVSAGTRTIGLYVRVSGGIIAINGAAINMLYIPTNIF